MLERCQMVSLKVLLASKYVDYSSSLKICNLKLLSERRESKVLQHPQHKRLFNHAYLRRRDSILRLLRKPNEIFQPSL